MPDKQPVPYLEVCCVTPHPKDDQSKGRFLAQRVLRGAALAFKNSAGVSSAMRPPFTAPVRIYLHARRPATAPQLQQIAHARLDLFRSAPPPFHHSGLCQAFGELLDPASSCLQQSSLL
jgi:hypothetical protein